MITIFYSKGQYCCDPWKKFDTFCGIQSLFQIGIHLAGLLQYLLSCKIRVIKSLKFDKNTKQFRTATILKQIASFCCITLFSDIWNGEAAEWIRYKSFLKIFNIGDPLRPVCGGSLLRARPGIWVGHRIDRRPLRLVRIKIPYLLKNLHFVSFVQLWRPSIRTSPGYRSSCRCWVFYAYGGSSRRTTGGPTDHRY